MTMAPKATALPMTPGSVTALRILIVDDNVDSADSLASLLELEGHVAIPVYSAHEALEKLASTSVEAVVLDIGLPQMDGYEVARALRAACRSSCLQGKAWVEVHAHAD